MNDNPILIFLALILLGMVLFILLLRRKPAAQDDSATREARIFKLYQNLEDMMDSFEAYVEQTQADFDRQKAELSGLLQRLGEGGAEPLRAGKPEPGRKQELSRVGAARLETMREALESEEPGEFTQAAFDVYNYEPQTQKLHTTAQPLKEAAGKLEAELEREEGKKQESKPSAPRSKTDQVRLLHSEGYSSEEIARDLRLSRGEVQLIVGLNFK